MSKYERMIRTAGDPILSVVCEPVGIAEIFHGWIGQLQHIARKHRRCAGLAAPQIGIAKRAFVTMVSDGKSIRLRTFINPIIVARSEETSLREEQCLSYPGKAKVIRRHDWITVQYSDQKRPCVTEEFREPFLARVIQHEMDHLDGICRVGDDSPPDGELPETNPLIAAAVAAGIAGSRW